MKNMRVKTKTPIEVFNDSIEELSPKVGKGQKRKGAPKVKHRSQNWQGLPRALV